MSHSVNDVYVLGHLAYQTDQNGTVLATFTDDSRGVPASVQVGSDPATAPRYYYVYNGHGDVVALVDAQGTAVANYAYDAFGQLTSFSENFGGTTTWTNPYLYDGRDGVRYDGETGLYWMSVRAYDPALGRFLSRDPLNRVPLFFSEQPYAYAGNNSLIHVDPSGQKLDCTVGCGTAVGSPPPPPPGTATTAATAALSVACDVDSVWGIMDEAAGGKLVRTLGVWSC